MPIIIENNEIINYCDCGCGTKLPLNKHFVDAYNGSASHRIKLNGEILSKIKRHCACGCGKEVKFAWVRGHWYSGINGSKEKYRYRNKKDSNGILIKRNSNYPTIKKIVETQQNIISILPKIDTTNAHKKCWACGGEKPLQKCHIQSVAFGGHNNPENLLLLCRECHAVQPDACSYQTQIYWLLELNNKIN